MTRYLTRRESLRMMLYSMAAAALPRFARWLPRVDFPPYPRLGRNTSGGRIEIKARPDATSKTIGYLFEDAVVPWLREVVGYHPYRVNQRFVDIGEGYVWAPYLQPVQNNPQTPLAELPTFGQTPGMWVEVSVPYVDLIPVNPELRSPYWKEAHFLRMYYSQVFWVDRIRTDSQGRVWYHVIERYGTYGDTFWAPGEAFRVIRPEEITPISPEVENKRVVVDVTYQTMRCYEGNTEVFYCRVSTGAKYNIHGQRVDTWATPLGTFPIWRKLVSLHMSGGTTGGGWDVPGVPWVSLFEGNGVAVHGTYWHNNYGVPMSNGCVNAKPEDSLWVFRWTYPAVAYDPGDLTIPMPGGTKVTVIES